MERVTSEEKKKCQTKLKYLVNTHVITTKHIKQKMTYSLERLMYRNERTWSSLSYQSQSRKSKETITMGNEGISEYMLSCFKLLWNFLEYRKKSPNQN